MKTHLWKFYVFALCLCFTSVQSRAGSATPDLPFASGETLYYKLSYRGLLTSMIWADLADASMTFLANQQALDTYYGHQFILNLSTENYAKAEMIQPVRYTYTATVDKTLEKILLVEKKDAGKKQSHDVLWLDWQHKTTHLFKKREKVAVGSDFFALDNTEVWEPDGALMLPEFLNNFPVLDNNLSYFIHDETGDNIERNRILEPLSLIYMLRTVETSSKLSEPLRAGADFASSNMNKAGEIAIAISDDIRVYRIEKIGLQTIELAGNSYQAIQYKIQSDEKKGSRFYIWLNNNAAKVPLRLSMEAPLGRLEINLVNIKQSEDETLKNLGKRTLKKFPASI